MKFNVKLAALTLITITALGGCSKIPGYVFSSPDSDYSSESEGNIIQNTQYHENKTARISINRTNYSEIYEAEDFAAEDDIKVTEEGYSGNGYVQLGKDADIIFEVNVPSTQHYKLYAASYKDRLSDNAVLSVTSGTVLMTDYGAVYVTGEDDYDEYELDGIFLEKGKNTVTIHAESGLIYLDYVRLVNSDPIGGSVYENKTLLAKSVHSTKTANLITYLSDIYGSATLTGQFCSSNTNAEIDAIYNATGRYPAIRCADIGAYSSVSTVDDGETEKMIEWAKKGGIVSLSWYWNAPLGEASYYSLLSSFQLDRAITTQEIALKDIAEISALQEYGRISDECFAVVSDIDLIAGQLKTLMEADVPVLWRPIHGAGNAWYWWGNCTPDSYVWLWKLMYDRLVSYHGLNNLIWVWNGESADWYPGDKYVDIVSGDIYAKTVTSGYQRFKSLISYGGRQMAALTESTFAIDPDMLARDNVMWLWFAVWSGEYLIDEYGKINNKYTNEDLLVKAYNHELTITLDELPDFAIYGITQDS